MQQLPIKSMALASGLPLLQPERVNSRDTLEAIAAFEPDALIVAAFGQILKQPLLDIPKRGSLNVHASLLPKYRGAAPIAGALMMGEHVTGVTIMEVELALDAGPMLAQKRLAIQVEDTSGTLTDKLAELGADLLLEVLPAWYRRKLIARPQDGSQASYVKPIRRQDAVVDWKMTAQEIALRVRAYNPWPVATTTVDGAPLRILEARPLVAESGAVAGTVVGLSELTPLSDAGFAVQCGSGLLAIVRVQRSGKRVMSGHELLHGWRDLIGKTLGT